MRDIVTNSFSAALLVAMVSAGASCRTEPQDQNKAEPAAADSATQDLGGAVYSESVQSADGKLSLRTWIYHSKLFPSANIPLRVELVNESAEPITVLKPLADSYHDQSTGIGLRGPNGPCKYIGPTPTYTLGEEAFVTLQPGEATGGYLELQAANFERADEPGVYRLVYRYQVHDGHVRTAEDRAVSSLWKGEIDSPPILLTRGDVPRLSGPVGGEPEQQIKVKFPAGGYRFTLSEAAAGVKLRYEIVVAKDLPGVVSLPQDVGSAMGAGPSGLAPFERIHGQDQSHALSDIGLGAGPGLVAKTIPQSRYVQTIAWDGRNWGGPSDTGMPKGDPFPAGEYQLTVSIVGNVDTPAGRRFYEIRRSAPVVLRP